MASSEAADVEDNNAFCEKIINEIHAVVLKDPDLTGFEIIPMPSNTNKTPVVHAEHNLGLQSWCVKYIYEYSHRLILQHKADCCRLPAGTGSASTLNSSGSSSSLLLMGGVGSNSIIKYLNCAILINPDVATFWNLRRQLFAKNRLDITREFQFTTVVLSKKPKSNEAFAYRRWLYLFQSFDAIDWSFEISLCEKCADKSTTNYHAWSHRQWVILKAPHLLKFEIYKTEKFIRKHIHDYSCYNHRQFVLAKMLELMYFDDDDGGNLTDLLLYVGTLLDTPVENMDDLLKWLVPNVDRVDINETKLKSFLFCLNLAVYDLRLCDELRSVYGASQAFENHRRYMVKFVVDRCRGAQAALAQEKNGEVAACKQPLNKITKLDDQDSAFIRAVKNNERNHTASHHQQWCQLFLGSDKE